MCRALDPARLHVVRFARYAVITSRAIQITASFQVTGWNEEPLDERNDAAKLTSARVTKSYSGEIDGDSVTEWLMAYTDDGAATFVGLERVTGLIAGRTGAFV